MSKRRAITLWVLAGVMLLLGVVFNNAGQTMDSGASLIQGMLGANLLAGGLIVIALAVALGGRDSDSE